MNILVIAHSQGLDSPTAIFIDDQIEAYIRLGHTVRVISPVAYGKPRWGGSRFDAHIHSENINGINYTYLRYITLSHYGEKHFNTASAIAALSCSLKSILKGFSPDVIHAHTLGFDSEIGKWLKKKLNCPLVVTTHGSDTAIPLQNGEGEFLKKCCDGVDTVVAVSSVLADKLRSCGTNTGIISILNGFNLQYLPEPAEKVPFSMIQVGHLIPQKRVDVSLRAFAKIKARYPAAVMTVIGRGSETEALKQLCEELNIAESVRFLGQVPNQTVLNEMAKAQFFVMPSVREGFGIVYLEAMANKCITIGTEGEGISDLIVSGENGFLVPPDDPEKITEVILSCLSDPADADAIAAKGRQDALSLTWERNAEQYIALFENILRKM